MAGAAPPVHASLAGSDLADAHEPVRLCPLPLDLEGLSKLWSVFFQTPHALSVAWSASVVFVEESLALDPALPVTTSVVSVAPMLVPTISSVAVADDPDAVLTTESVARLSGRQLAAQVTTVRVAGRELEPMSATAYAVDVDLAAAPAGALRAGPAAVEVVHRRSVGEPPALREDVTSRPFLTMLHPRITAAVVNAGAVGLECVPPVGGDQEVVLQLRDPGATAPPRILAVEHPGGGDVGTLTVPLAGVEGGTYDAVLAVDGAPSAPVPVVVP